MKKTFLLFTALIVLTACSAHTIVAADVDLLSLASDSEGLSGDLTVPGAIQIYVPDADDDLLTPDGGYLIDNLPTLSELYGFGISLTVEVKNTGSGPLTFGADFRLASADDSTNIYDGNNDVSIASDSVDLDPGESGTVELNATLSKDDPNLSLITENGFRIGVALEATGSTTVQYELTSFRVIVEQKPFDLIPPP